MGNHDAARARVRTGAVSETGTPQNGSRAAGQRLTSLSNWPVSRRLFAVIALALVMGLVFGGLEVASAESSATQYSRVLQLAKLGQQDVILAHDLQNERDSTLGLTSGGSTGNLAKLHDATNAEAAKVLALGAGVDGRPGEHPGQRGQAPVGAGHQPDEPAERRRHPVLGQDPRLGH